MQLDLVQQTATLSEDQKLSFAGIWLLKKMDIPPEDGGMVMPIVMPPELGPLDDVLEKLYLAGYVELDRKKERYQISKAGYAYIGQLMDEAEALVAEFEDHEVRDVVEQLRAEGLDVLRARFLWEWYTGELDDLVLFQERHGITPVERLWAHYLVSDEFYRALGAGLG